MYCKCGARIPNIRVKLGYKFCVGCSTETKWGCAQVVYHKTGNTIEVIKDPELCEEVNRAAQRSSFGVCRGMTSSGKRKPQTPRQRKPVSAPVDRVLSRKRPSEASYDFHGVGTEATELLYTEGLDAALAHLDRAVQAVQLSPGQRKQLRTVLKHLSHNVTQ